MTEPVSIIALSAAVGGVAGKIAEKAWDSGERWLRERFGSHACEVQAQAHANMAQFVEYLAKRVKVLEDSRAIDAAYMAEAERHPQFSLLLQRSLLNSAQTEDAVKQEILANLVATRLTSASETTVALASQLASDAIAQSTRRQLMLMGLSSFLDDVRLRDPMTNEDFRLWIELHLKPFRRFEFKKVDALHLVAIACASYDPTSEKDLIVLLQMKGGAQYLELQLDDLPSVEDIQVQWGEGLAGVSLTSVGMIVGALVFDKVMGSNLGIPKWD